MGKRKYEIETTHSSKKSKEEDSQHEDGASKTLEEAKVDQIEVQEAEPAAANRDSQEFNIKHFRKELTKKQGQTIALTQFLQVCLNPDSGEDFMLQYLNSGGNSHEILRQITQDNRKNLTLATPAFHLFHLIVMKVQSSVPHMIAITEEACRYFLNTFMSTVEIMISEHSGPRHRKIILKLFTSMVTLNPDLGLEILNQAPLTPKHLQYIVEKVNSKEKDNVRTTFVHFMTSFLIEGHLPLIKALLEKQGLLALVIPGLGQDEGEAVLMFLNILKKNVIDNINISKSLKLRTFSHQVLHNIFRIYYWKGPPEGSYESKTETRTAISSLVSEILLALFTSHKTGLYFMDQLLGTSDANKNQNLYKALLTLKRPWENANQCDVILEIVWRCPDLHRALINILEQSFEPQHSTVWENSVEFVIKLLDKMKPEDMVPRMTHLSSVQVANFVRFTTLPIPLLKFFQQNLMKNDLTLSLICIKVLVKMLSTLRRYFEVLEMNSLTINIADLKTRLESFFPKHLPGPSVIVSIVNDIIKGKSLHQKVPDYEIAQPDSAGGLILLLDLLLLYHDIHSPFFETIEGNLQIKEILLYATSLSTENVTLLKFKIISLWLLLDSSAILLQNPMFKDLFLIMLEVYTNPDQNMWIDSKHTVYNFFKNTGIFENDDGEIDIMLYTLRAAEVKPISVVADIIEHILANITDLKDLVRNQIAASDIGGGINSSHIEKLFDDMLEDKIVDEQLFLDMKTPSPFISGCLQYMQKNKTAKKSLKKFLSLYVVNLLHYNGSPEFIQDLMADSYKYDAREYVSSWLSTPIPLGVADSENDTTLTKISHAIVNSNEISFQDVFQYFIEVPKEESLVIISGVPLKINPSITVDSSELVIWANCLIFNLVQLSKLRQFDIARLEKITTSFEYIMEIAKISNMVDVCRKIILSVFKNANLLHLYSPIEKDGSGNTLVTQFILESVKRYDVVVTYLHGKHNILNPFQQKNFAELSKVLKEIKKHKNTKSEQAVKAIEVIGMKMSDDLEIFKNILEVDISCWVRDDGEPPLVAELLGALIRKYKITLNVDLPPDTIKSVFTLYTNILTNPLVNPNIIHLETTLTEFFESKPYQVKLISEECFEKIFSSKVVRKTTSQIAAVLLQCNEKFCNVYKEQISKPEILAQRELTLPLGNALVNHKQFVIENQLILENIYKEYKSNIFKFLEKPHKVGQIYISNYLFIRKLIIECTEAHECEKFFDKIHKFETVEKSHVSLLQALYIKMCTVSKSLKKEHLINYFSIMMNLLTYALKEGTDSGTVTELVSNIYCAVQISKGIKGFETKQQQNFQKFTESSVWQNFCKAVLKDSLKINKSGDDVSEELGPKLLSLFSTLVKLVYPFNHEDITNLFDMVTSHSEFLNIMLSYHSPHIKSRLVELLYVLILRNKSVMKSQQIPVYLSAYHATRSPCDRLILTILHFYETNGQPIHEYKPYVWGDSAANYYSVRKNRSSSLWGHPTPNQILNLFDKDAIDRTIRLFPVNQQLNYHYELPPNIHMTRDQLCYDGSLKTLLDKLTIDGLLEQPIKHNDKAALAEEIILKSKYNKILMKVNDLDNLTVSHADSEVDWSEVYDPAFVFPLLSHLLAPGSMASCFKLLRTGLLSLPVVALASHCPSMRAAAYHVLHRFCLLLETESKHKNDKLLLTDFIDTLRQSLSSAIVSAQKEKDSIKDQKNPRLPAVVALFLARALSASTAPFDPLYKPVNNFLIAKQQIDLTVVPDFLGLFHDSDIESSERRHWILNIIRDGTKTMTDVNVVSKTMCLKMIMGYFSTVLCDRKTKEHILNVLNSLVAIPRAAEILIEGYGLLSWITAAVRSFKKEDKVLVKSVVILVHNMLYSSGVTALAKAMASSKKVTKNAIMDIKDFRELKVNKELESQLLVVLLDLLPLSSALDPVDLLLYVKIYSRLSRKVLKAVNRGQLLLLVKQCSGCVGRCNFIQLLSRAISTSDCDILKIKNVLIDFGDSEDVLVKENIIREIRSVTAKYLQ